MTTSEMTNEKAKDLLDNLVGMVEDNNENDYDTALKMGIRAIDALEKIRAEIQKMDFDFGDFYDHTDEIVERVCKVIDKYAEQEPTIPCDLCGFKMDEFEFCEYLSDCPATGKAVS